MSLWIDVTTTAMCAPPHVGISRVEASLAEQLRRQAPFVRTCIYEAEPGRFSELPAREFMRLRQRNGSSDAYAATEVEVERHDLAAAGGAEIFSPGDALVSCGFNWRPGFGNMGRLYAMRHAMGLRLITMCYDMVPLKLTHFIPALEAVFRDYMRDMALHADHILCISQSTRHDLLQWLDSRGETAPETSVMPLGCELTPAAGDSVGEAVARVLRQPFLLSVGTIEDRKNHRTLCRAYSKLMASGVRELPALVFAGAVGAGGQSLLAEIAANRSLAEKITVLSGVSDRELIALYDGCVFTLYPSHYEGWGLPVSESLARGKFCLASNRASLPEAGEDFADYADPSNVEQWAGLIDHYLRTPDAVAERELAIRRRFKPKRWQDAAAHVLTIAGAPTAAVG